MGVEHFERIDRQLIAKGAIVDYYHDMIKTPNGNIVTWDFIWNKGAAAVVPVRDDGKIVMDDTMVNLKYNYLDKKIIELKLEKEVDFSNVDGVRVIKAKDTSLKIEINTKQIQISEIIKRIDPENLIDINISNIPLEDIISSIYRSESNK